jgi:hypothetical protein
VDYVFIVGTFLLAAYLLALGIWRRGADVGQTRFFHNQTYHFQTLRVFNDIPAGGADTGEISSIRSGDAQSWYRGWEAAAERAMALAARSFRKRGRRTGQALSVERADL